MTICKPNITNVVRPVVKVVVTPTAPAKQEAEIETVVEDAEIEVESDDEVEVSATVEAEDELDSEIADILASIPDAEEEAPDENTVDVIDIFWDENKEKSYKYDPDGNDVEEGDVVLVPTRDEASDKDIVREAEVLRGNYKVEISSLEHPLKKIIGVVRRKATKVFTAMITPEDEDGNGEA